MYTVYCIETRARVCVAESVGEVNVYLDDLARRGLHWLVVLNGGQP